MLQDLLPFPLPFTTMDVAGALLWSLALYLGLSPLTEWIMVQVTRWLNYAEQFLYFSEEELERTRAGWESRNEFYASLLSVVPFLVMGTLCHYGINISLGSSWAVSGGLIATISCGVYELGRRTGDASDAE